MKITHGLLTGQVLQRNKDGKGGALLRGRCKARGDVDIRVLKAGKVLPCHNWKMAGKSEAKSFEAVLANLRTGGPYQVELRVSNNRRILEQMRIENIFVGDVWILAGQSNMEGVGNLVHAPKAHDMIRAFYMRDEWDIAKEPIHFLGEAVDVFHNAYGNSPNRPPKHVLQKRLASFVKGMCPGHVFALEMYKRTHIPQGLIPCAHGGTSMAQWSPSLRDQGGASLYGAMMRRYERLGQKVAGVLWYQGESDANRDDAPVYTQKMIELIESTRCDMNIPQLPWLVVQLGCHAAKEPHEPWNSIQEQQRRLPQNIKYIDVVPAIDLELDDGIHIGGKGHHILGHRLARIADRLVHRTRGVKPAITVKHLEIIRTPEARPEAACSSVRITYDNVVGRLVSDGRPTGFTLLNEKGQDIGGIYKTSLSGKTVTIHTNMSKAQLLPHSVSYGHGRCPVCNITDSDGMSIPVMQAVEIDPEHAPFCNSWQSAQLHSAKTLAGTTFAKVKTARRWQKAHLRNLFGVLPTAPKSKKTGIFAFRTTITAIEAVETHIFFGANAPFKLWQDGKLLLTDPNAEPPIDSPLYSSPLKLKEGKNALYVAFVADNPAPHIGIWAKIGTNEEKVDPRISF